MPRKKFKHPQLRIPGPVCDGVGRVWTDNYPLTRRQYRAYMARMNLMEKKLRQLMRQHFDRRTADRLSKRYYRAMWAPGKTISVKIVSERSPEKFNFIDL